MKKEYLIGLGIICVLLLFVTINNKVSLQSNNDNIASNEIIDNNEDVDNSTKDNNLKLTWDEYQLLFEHIFNNLDIEGVEINASTIGANLSKVEKEWTFNKKEFLTIYGTYSLETTEEHLVLEDDSQGKQITIAILYTDNYIDDNLIGYVTNSDFINLNQTLANKTAFSVLTYKNLVIVIQQISIDEFDPILMNLTIKSVVDLLTEY